MRIHLILLFFLQVFGLFAQSVCNFRLSPCKGLDDIYSTERILSAKEENDTLTLELRVMLNCCVNAQVQVEFQKDTLVVVVKDTDQVWCACNCLYNLQLRISEMNLFKTPVRFNGNLLYPDTPDHFLFPIDYQPAGKTQVNCLNAAREPIGYWVKITKSSAGRKIKIEQNYMLLNGVSQLVWEKISNRKGEVLEIGVLGNDGGFHLIDPANYEHLYHMYQPKEP